MSDEMKKEMPSFLSADKVAADKLELTDSVLATLTDRVKSLENYRAEIKLLENDMEVLKKREQDLSMKEIPELLNGCGLVEIKLKDGTKVTAKRNVSVKIKKENEQDFYSFLASRNEEDIIKLQFQFDRMEASMQSDLMLFLTGNGYSFDYEKGVHHKTLEKYFRELLGLDLTETEQKVAIAEKRVLRIEDVVAFAEVFTFYKTVVKRPV